MLKVGDDMIIPLKVVSDYSLLSSLISLPNLINYLKDNKITICGLCDDNLFGVMEFYDLCTNNHIKPLIGLKVPFLNCQLCFYAQNYHGYQNLLKIHTARQKNEDIASLDKSLFTDILVLMNYEDILSFETINTFFKDNLYLCYQKLMLI